MSTPNPLIPQGTLQAKGARGASNIRIAVATIIAIHVVFFGGLLLQGCKRDTRTADAQTNVVETNAALTLPPMDTSASSLYYTATNLPTDSQGNLSGSAATNIPESTALATNVPHDPWNPTAGSGLTTTGRTFDSGTKEYTIVSGDSFYKIAKANNTTIGALQRANPDVEASRIRPGMKIKIPLSDPATSSGASGNSAVAGNGTVYVVKPGDNLSKIARQHGVTIKSIQAANNMRTTRVNAGQKLKLPAKNGAPGTNGNTTVGSTNPGY